jgi:hypothetical protein
MVVAIYLVCVSCKNGFKTVFLTIYIFCTDVEGPKFYTCPLSTVVFTSRGKDTAIATWSVPIVTDNYDRKVNAIQLEGPSSNSLLKVGTHKIVYGAKDTAGNWARNCSFHIISRRKFCF